MISVNKETFEEEVLKYKGKVVVEYILHIFTNNFFKLQ